MLRKNFLALFVSISLYGNEVHDKIINLIGKDTYELNKQLLTDSFPLDSNTQTNQKLDYMKILHTLKKESLLNLTSDDNSDITILFHISNKNKKGFKIVKDTVSNIGYSYFNTDFLRQENGNLSWKIRFKSDYILDPYLFLKELNKLSTQITDISKISQNDWEYTIDSEFGTINTNNELVNNLNFALPMPLEPYILSIKSGNELSIKSDSTNRWIPKISFYDGNINTLEIVEMESIYENLKMKIPKQTIYIKIEDKYSLKNIKRGLEVQVSN